jgi:hypothetical protein
MRRIRTIIIILTLLGIWNIGIIQPTIIQAQGGAPCADREPEHSGVLGCTPWIFSPMDMLRIRTRLDSAWLRSAPSSDAAVVAKVPRKPYNNLQVAYDIAPNNTWISWDGTQWWWYVKVIRGKRAQGWVEQASLVKDFFGAKGPRGLAAWGTPSLAKVRGKYAVKAVARPYGDLQDNLEPGTAITLLMPDSMQDEPQWIPEIRSWLWRINYNTAAGSKIGWIDQRAITAVKRQ